MDIHDIAHLPTTFEVKVDYDKPGYRPPPHHESLLRGYQIVQKVKDLLKRGCPNDILLELIGVMEYRHVGTTPHVHVRMESTDE